MASVRLPAVCPDCGAVFPSSIAIGPGGSGVVRFNAEVCPRCGGLAMIANATYKTVAGELLAVIEAPGVTREMLIAFRAAARRAYEERKPPEALAAEVEKINPGFGAAILKIARAGFYRNALLAIILATIASCDLNRLIDQLMEMSPREVITAPEPPPPPAPEKPEMKPETKPDNPRTI